MKILYKFASRSRPEKFIACIENIYAYSHNKDFKILASLDTDDTTMNNESMKEKMKQFENLFPVFGMSRNKVHAINRDMEKGGSFDILINFSDDMLFIKEGYDIIIEEAMKKNFPDGDCLLHFPDQNQGENCMTMSIMDRKYYNRFCYIYHPDYANLECDVDAMEVGKILGRYKFINERIINHYHPSFGQTSYDAQYEKTEGRNDPIVRQRDVEIYRRRLKNNFYL